MSQEYKYVIGGDSLQEVANQFAELVAARGRLTIQANNGNANKKWAKWTPTEESKGARAASIEFDMPEYLVNKLQPELARVSVSFANLQTSQGVAKFREQKAATITARLQRDIAEAQRLGLDIPGVAKGAEVISTEVEQDNAAGAAEVTEGE